MLHYPNFWNHKSTLNYLLLPLSWIYSLANKIRKYLIHPIKFSQKVICVGNATVGGTGKTQIIMFIANQIARENNRYFIVSKGYKGNFDQSLIVLPNHNVQQVGDEALMMAQQHRVIITKTAKDLERLLNTLSPDQQPEYLIFDDWLQNPSFNKDITIMTIDGYRGYGNSMIIPAGPMRVSLEQANSSADYYIIVGEDKFSLSKSLPENRLYFAQMIPNQEFEREKKYFAFAGIGNPEKFFITLENNGYIIEKRQSFPDHYFYSDDDLEKLLDQSKELQLITTAKDYIKIPAKYHHQILKFDISIQSNFNIINILS